ncbi:peptidylprolyl isomerase [candidate division KSB1 bacterium]|nr:peptidylprolyl isomerase [candidate division KSB1 bacterium]
MAQAKRGDQVKVHYTGKLADGQIFDSSVGSEPLEFTIGEGNLISGFEAAVVGMSPGESKNVAIPANQAYGPSRQDLVMVVERQQIPPSIQPEVGQLLELRHGENESLAVMVTEVSPTTITLDANHPLAGKNLTFEIELVKIV